MAISKVTLNGTTLMDVTSATAAAADITAPKTAMLANGVVTTGTGSGGGELEELDVALYDYDGTLLHTYTAEDFLELNALPDNPSHEGLTAQGWNWTLSDAKEYVTKYGALSIGQVYTPSDCDSRFIVNVESGDQITIALTADSAGTIDWGDGSGETEIVATNTHVFTSPGRFYIKIETTKTNQYFPRITEGAYFIEEANFGAPYTSVPANYYECTAIKYLSMSVGTTRVDINAFNKSAFLRALILPSTATNTALGANSGLSSLEVLSFPKNFTYNSSAGIPNGEHLKMVTLPESETPISVGVGSRLVSCKTLIAPSISMPNVQRLQKLSSLRRLYIGDGSSITSTGHCFWGMYVLEKLDLSNFQIGASVTNTFQDLYSLTELILPDDLTAIGTNSFKDIYLLEALTIPQNVTSIANNTFTDAKSLREVHLLPTTPPSLAGTSVFTNRRFPCVLYVPYSADHSILEAYQTATNWSTFASYMQEEPQ